MKSETNFLLGVANYKLQKQQEAVNYFRAVGPGPFKTEAGRNIARIQQEYRGIK